jgi:hypothetical protein
MSEMSAYPYYRREAEIVKETGILFTSDNIRAIREGRKTQTRRVWNKQPYMSRTSPPNFNDTKVGNLFICRDPFPTGGPVGLVIEECESLGVYHGMGSDAFVRKHGPKNYGVAGDRLYIKEGVIVQRKGWSALTERQDGTLIGYYMDGRRVENESEKSLAAMFMAKRYARTWLEITEVRVERVQDISAYDCFEEGIPRPQSLLDGTRLGSEVTLRDNARGDYRKLWDSINRNKHLWSSNPWCWCLTFKVLLEERRKP